MEERNRKQDEVFRQITCRKMMDDAIRRLEQNGVDVYKLRGSCIKVQNKMISGLVRFDSVNEVFAAVTLTHMGVECMAQQKIGRKRADFVLPDLRAVLEIDGERHKGRAAKDKEWDEEVRSTLGSEWEVVRIQDGYLTEYHNTIIEMVRRMRTIQQEARKQFGEIPIWFYEKGGQFNRYMRSNKYSDPI
jgi:very-short-patch-repair endonuclease